MPSKFRFISLHSLGGKIMSILGTALLSSMVLFALSVFYFTYRTESEAWRGRQAEAARNAAGTVSGFIQRVEDTLTLLGIVEPDHHITDPHALGMLLDQNNALLEIVRIDSSGAVIGNAHRDRDVLTNLITIPQSQWFLQARAGQAYIGNVQLSAQNNPYLIMAVPSADGGVVAARVEMNVLWEVVKNIHFGESGQAYVISRNGQIVAHTNVDVVLNNASIADLPEFAEILAAPNHEWSGTFINFEGRRVVGNTNPIDGTDWLVVTELSQSEAFLATRNAIFALGALAFLLMALVSWAVARHLRLLIVNPMERLREGAGIIGQGNLDHRIRLKRMDEIGELSDAFDAMAGKLHDRENLLAKQIKETQRSEARYRAIVEDQTELICRFLTDGTLTFVNEAYCRYFDKLRDELVGNSFIPLIPDEDKLVVEAAFASLSMDNPVVTYEHRAIIPDGSLRWQSWTDRALFNAEGQVMEYTSVGRDITERKLAAEALQASEANLRRLNLELEERIRERTAELRDSEERYSIAVRGANDGLWDWNLKTNEIYFSPRWKTMLGYSQSQIKNEPEEWFRRIHPEDLAWVQAAISNHVNGDTEHFRMRISDARRQQRIPMDPQPRTGGPGRKRSCLPHGWLANRYYQPQTGGGTPCPRCPARRAHRPSKSNPVRRSPVTAAGVQQTAQRRAFCDPVH